jgi:hypothetical protein
MPKTLIFWDFRPHETRVSAFEVGRNGEIGVVEDSEHAGEGSANRGPG